VTRRLGVSYYHSKMPVHAAADFQALLDAGMNTVVLAVSEDDCYHWFPNMKRIVQAAKDAGLFVYWNFWGWGHVFGGEPSSRFLDEHTLHRQVTAATKTPLAAACIQDPAFTDYLLEWVRRVAREIPVDGFFIDEPHYSFIVPDGSWTCRCQLCQTRFKEEYGVELPEELTEEAREFREKQLLGFIESILGTIKTVDSTKRTAVVLFPFEEGPVAAQAGTLRDWDRLAALPTLDVFGTDPYCHLVGLPLSWAEEIARRTISIANEHHKRSQLWVQLFSLTSGSEQEVATLVERYADLGVDEILAWTYRAAEGTTIACERPEAAWHALLRAFRSTKRTRRVPRD
jgi:hypothetical protein